MYNEQLEWEVDHVLHSRRKYHKLQYQVKWTGVDHDPVFYDAESFKGSPHKIKAFHDQYPDAIGPPVNLQYWIDCYLEGKEPEDRIDDNGCAVQ